MSLPTAALGTARAASGHERSDGMRQDLGIAERAQRSGPAFQEHTSQLAYLLIELCILLRFQKGPVPHALLPVSLTVRHAFDPTA